MYAMKRLFRFIILVCVLAALAQAQVPKPKLVLTIVVDQFRYDYLTRFRSEYKGGLARLLEKGAVFTNANYEHFPTVTAVGHSTILSGATPSISGIVGNTWYDRASNKQVTSVSDDSVRLLGGAPGRTGSSPRQLLVSTIGDELKLSARGESRVIGVSLKDRAAILPAGRMADGAFWFDDTTGNFVSSTYYFADLPAWAATFNKSRSVDKYLGAAWTPVGGGQPFRTMGAVADRGYFASMERTPFGNEIVEAFAEAALAGVKLGQHSGIDLLSVSFSANDYVGHGVGPDAPEVRDISITTDRVIQKLFDFVDKQVGLDNVLVVMTADHGVSPLPEFALKQKLPGGRMSEKSVLDAIRQGLTAAYGPGDWISGNSGPAPYFNLDLIRQKKLKAADVENTAAEAARNIPHIFRVYTREQLMFGRALEDTVDRCVRNGFNANRASDLFIVSEPYWIFEERGASHGTPYSYDTHVPVIFMGRGIRPGRYNGNIFVNDVASTLATMLDIETPSGASGRALSEILGQ